LAAIPYRHYDEYKAKDATGIGVRIKIFVEKRDLMRLLLAGFSHSYRDCGNRGSFCP
jgi:hypothetical protein